MRSEVWSEVWPAMWSERWSETLGTGGCTVRTYREIH